MTPEHDSKLTEAIFQRLAEADPVGVRQAEDAVWAFTRFHMRPSPSPMCKELPATVTGSDGVHRMVIYDKLLVRLHCDEPDCDLGTLEFKCPACSKEVVNYDDWRTYMKWFANTGDDYVFEVSCPECKATIRTGLEDDLKKETP